MHRQGALYILLLLVLPLAAEDIEPPTGRSSTRRALSFGTATGKIVHFGIYINL